MNTQPTLTVAVGSAGTNVVQPAAPRPTLEDYLNQIMSAHSEVLNALAQGASAAIRAGHALIAVKKTKMHGKHGDWQDFVTVICGLRIRTAQIYMYLAKHEAQLKQLLATKTNGNAFLSQGEALRFLSVAKKHRSRRRRLLTMDAQTKGAQ